MNKALVRCSLCLLLCNSAAGAEHTTAYATGLQQPAEILVDRWGVPHLYAANQQDVFFVQGYNAARDRLFQIDLWRRRGLGRLAEVFGPTFVEQDRAARLFLYRGDMAKEWLAYGPQAQDIAERFVAGINAYIDQLERTPHALPFEFKKFAYRPEKWRTDDVVRIRSHALTRNLASEVARAQVACKADLKLDALRVHLEPPWETHLPDGLDPCLPANVLQVYQLATQGVSLSQPSQHSGASQDRQSSPQLAMDAPMAGLEGSNAWVIAPAKSSTGRAILAGDPHRSYSVPSLRYLAHLHTPAMDVIGAGEPALPGISIGHNQSIAFGLTIFGIDQEDLYVYAMNPQNPQQYRYQNQWEDLTVVHERIAVKGAAPVDVDLPFTRHGPLIFREAAKNRAFAVRSGWFEPGMAPYFGSIQWLTAQNFEAFKQAMRHWGAPAENQVYADTQGNIAWVPGGLAPIRPNWDGLLPGPGDGRYEWNGFLDGALLPSAYNPAQGWFASANEMNLPSDFAYRQHKLGFEWASRDRYDRLAQVLGGKEKISLEDSMRLQNDVLSTTGQRIVALLKPLRASDADTAAALKLLQAWDGVESAGSGPAALFEIWWSRYLLYAGKQVLLGSNAAANSFGPLDPSVLLDMLEQPSKYWPTNANANANAQRDGFLLASLAMAWRNAQQLLGADVRKWRWGQLHHAAMAHPLAGALDSAGAAKLNIGPLPQQGGYSTPNVSSYDPRDFHQLAGASFRVVVDVGNWDNSRAINTPGQSGDPDSPHYRDLTSLWLRGAYFPLLYSRKAVEAATVQRITLLPAPAAKP